MVLPSFGQLNSALFFISHSASAVADRGTEYLAYPDGTPLLLRLRPMTFRITIKLHLHLGSCNFPIKRDVSTITTAVGVLCALVEGRKNVHCSHIDFLLDLQLRKMNAAI